MEITASHRFLRMSPRKVSYVAALVRGLSATDAEQQLAAHARAASEPILQTLRSAIANASQNFQIEKAGLIVKQIHVTQGPTLKRYRPRAFGRANMIRKRTSHVKIVLEAPDKTEEKKKGAKRKDPKKNNTAAT